MIKLMCMLLTKLLPHSFTCTALESVTTEILNLELVLFHLKNRFHSPAVNYNLFGKRDMHAGITIIILVSIFVHKFKIFMLLSSYVSDIF